MASLPAFGRLVAAGWTLVRADALIPREIDWVAGDAMALPFPDRSFDAFTIAFGIRNVTRVDRALAEARRGGPPHPGR